MTNREIAQALFVTLRTVEVHLTHAYQKLDISLAGSSPPRSRRADGQGLTPHACQSSGWQVMVSGRLRWSRSSAM